MKDVNKDGNDASYCDMICGDKYRKGTIIMILFGSFAQQSGANMFFMYSNRIITENNKYVLDDSKILANRAT